uniref:CCHC-type domain-containing protein n=1 Tax=Meloidogyne floridensis TaxID=298350 RepID=A0A915P3H9_9BILA
MSETDPIESETPLINKNLYRGKSNDEYAKIADLDKLLAATHTLEDSLNRNIRLINRRANSNTNAINQMAMEVNTYLSTVNSKVALISSKVDKFNQHKNIGEHTGNDETEPLKLELNMLSLLDKEGATTTYKEESVVSFDSWAQKFTDLMDCAPTTWDEKTKIHRLKLYLEGTTRIIFDKLEENEKRTVKEALASIRKRLTAPHRRELFKRELTLCRQRPSETVSEFMKRLTPLVKATFENETEEQQQAKIRDEFLERLKPNISFLIRLVGTATSLDELYIKVQEIEVLLASGNDSQEEALKRAVNAIQPQVDHSTNKNITSWTPISNNNRIPNNLTYQNQPQRTFGINQIPNNNYRNFRRGGSANQRNGRYQNNRRGYGERNWSGRPMCTHCGVTGHIAYNCWRRRQMPTNSNAVVRGGRNFSQNRANMGLVNNKGINMIQSSNKQYTDTHTFMTGVNSQPTYSQGSSSTPSQGEYHTSPHIYYQGNPMNSYPKEIQVYPQSLETSTLTSQIQNMNLYEPSKGIAQSEYRSQGQTSRTEPILNREPHNVESSISDWEQTSTAPKMKQLFYITLTFMMIMLPVANADIPFPKYPLICQNREHGILWNLPKFPGCPEQNTNLSKGPIPQRRRIYSPNNLEHTAKAWACRKVRKAMAKYTSLTGVHIEKPLSIDPIIVTHEECKNMIKYKKCEWGILKQEGELFHTDFKLDLTPRKWLLGSFNWERVYTENCYLFKTPISSRFGEKNIQTPLEENIHCTYKNGFCSLTDGTRLIWEIVPEANCEYLSIGEYDGFVIDNLWIASQHPLALTDTKTKNTGTNCGQKVNPTEQGLAYLIIQEKIKPKYKRNKRALEGIVTSSQLASELTYLNAQLSSTLSFTFSHTMKTLCDFMENTWRWAELALLTDPTILARTIFNNPDIHAERMGFNLIKVWPCIPITHEQFRFVPTGSETECFEYLPISFISQKQQHFAFIDPKTMKIVHDSHKTDCAMSRIIIIQLENDTFEVDQVTATMQKINPRNHETFNPRFEKIQPLSSQAFHQLVLVNISDINTHAHLSNAFKISEITYQIRQKDTKMIAEFSNTWQKAKSEFSNHIFGDWTHEWRIFITIITCISLIDFTLRALVIMMQRMRRI